MTKFYSASGNLECHAIKPDGYLTVEEWDALHPVPLPEPISLEELKFSKLQQIIVETEASILAGFAYEIDEKTLHFSYQYNDQQNFSDSALVAMLGQSALPDAPASVTWNGWEVEKDANGNEISRSLVLLNLTAGQFIELYTKGALVHKASRMAEGTRRKALVEAATTIEELEAI